MADKISTPRQTQQALLYRSKILIYYTTVRTPQREPTRQTRPTSTASQRIDKVDKFHRTLNSAKRTTQKTYRPLLAIFFRRS